MIFIIGGPSGVGKSFLCKNVVKNFSDFYLPRKHTTRSQRPNEDESEYYFVDDSEFFKLKDDNQFLVNTNIYDNWYGLLNTELEEAIDDKRNAIFILDVFLAQKFKNIFPKSILIFVQPANYKDLINHLKKREIDYKEDVKDRIKLINNELEQKEKFDYVIPFYNSEMSFELLKGIITEKYCRVKTFNDQIEFKLNSLFKIYPKVAVDIVVINEKKEVLLIDRWKKPFGFALPGGFVEYGESVEEAAIRELIEETSIATSKLLFLGVYSKPNRDPRTQVVSIAFKYFVNSESVKIKDGGDAKKVFWKHLSDLSNLKLVFDHYDIVKDAIKTI
ncbi:NUDIX domain-containing protein [Xanthomarina sp. F2636L]|uniref:NUDIX domain-containing protein n=1 Tax=Xanthomarina sp. F2636L TaxID=2996018 RepID=UPI00225E2A17|nr:NUDIX domain-containing protein [Xanthomarina sp. F2636L]MCX7549673.1 NUDIX domain-containing protein [Xanthomarina sp. F2636L]